MATFLIIDSDHWRRHGLRIFLKPPHDVVECSSIRESLSTCDGRAFKAGFIVWPEGATPAFADRATWSAEHVVLMVSATAQVPKGREWAERHFPKAPITFMRYPDGHYTFQEIRRAVSQVLDAPSVSGPEMVVGSRAMREVMERAARLASPDRPVLICGEPGTGKETLARWIHARSHRAQGPFEVFDCAGLEPAMAISELFGHEKGAFPWATQTKRGVLAAANGGTLYIREVSDLDRALQTRLLRLLDRPDGGAERLGGQEPHVMDVRLIAGCAQPLGERVGEEFSRDLYYRLRQNYLETPPLRSKLSDIPELVRHFLAHQQGAVSSGGKWEPQALLALQCYRWPGNLDELGEVISEAVLKAGPGEEVTLDHLPARLRNAAEQSGTREEDSAPPPRPLNPQVWPDVGFECDGYTMKEIISTTDRARVFLAERSWDGGSCVAKFSHSRNKWQREALKTIMGLQNQDTKAKEYTIPIFHADNCPGDKWFMVVLDRLDDARTGRKIDRGGCVPHTFGEWITRRHWPAPLDGHDGRAVISHIGAILYALRFFHAKELVMNDAKPENFGFYEGRLVAIDFGGFARRGLPPHEYDLAYSPPEERQGQPAEDLYAVAVMLGEAFYNIAPEELVPPRAPLTAKPYLDDGRMFHKLAWAILFKGLSLYSGFRYQEASTMLKDIEELKRKLEEDEAGADNTSVPK